MPVYSNLTSCGSCLLYGYFWILHSSGIQDCWSETKDIDDLAYATQPGQACEDLFDNLAASHWGIFAWFQMFVSLFIGVGFHASFQVVYDRYGKYGQMNPRFRGFSGFFRFLCRFVCSCFGYAGVRAPLLQNQAGSTGDLASVAMARAAQMAVQCQGTQTAEVANPSAPVAPRTTTRDVGTGGGPAAGLVRVEPEASIHVQVTPPPASNSGPRRHSDPANTSLLSAQSLPSPPQQNDLPELHSPASTLASPANTPPVLSTASTSSRSVIPAALPPPPRRQAAIESEKKTRLTKKQWKY